MELGVSGAGRGISQLDTRKLTVPKMNLISGVSFELDSGTMLLYESKEMTVCIKAVSSNYRTRKRRCGT
jgi:hypothetical protein